MKLRYSNNWAMFGLSAAAGLALALVPAARAQTIFSTTFNDYASGSSLSGQPTGGGAGSWDTNDPDNGASTSGGFAIGQSDYVGYIGNFTTGTAISGNKSGALGGLVQAGNPPVVPGQQTVYTYRTFDQTAALSNGSTGLRFSTDFEISKPNGDATQDSFAWTFRNDVQSLFAISFLGNNPAGPTIFSSSFSLLNGQTDTNTGFGLIYNSPYRLEISVDYGTSTFSAAITDVATNTRTAVISNAPAPNGFAVNQVAATWTIADAANIDNGGRIGAGGNSLLFDNYVVSVPEPSTYAMMGLGLLGTVGMMMLRRRQQA